MKTLLCFGDSNTWGSATFQDRGRRYPIGQRWPSILQERLGADWQVIPEGLSARTTVHPDPIEGPWLNGSAYLLPCLKSHRPLDLVVIMLGTNDLKQRFSVSAVDIAKGAGVLLDIVRTSQCGPQEGAPPALLICPPPILDRFGTRPEFAEIFAGGHEKSLKLAEHYRAAAAERGAAFMNAGEVIRSSAFDGIHLDADQQLALGNAVADKVAALGL
jgi:lysophospholipase L1-like esterase